MYIGSPDSYFHGCLQSLKGPGREDILWVDFSSSQIEKHWRQALSKKEFHFSGFKRIRCLVPHITAQDAAWLFIFETLCFLKEIQGRHGMELGYLPLSGDKRRDEEQMHIFIFSTLRAADPAPRIFRYEGQVQWWSPEDIRRTYACRLSERCLKEARRLEDAEPSPVPEDVAPWRRDFKKSFDEEFARLSRDFHQQLNELDFTTSPDQIISRFGRPRRISFDERVLGAIGLEIVSALQAQDRTGHEDTFFLFRAAINPFSALRDRLEQLEVMAPFFYDFPARGIEEIGEVQWDPEPGTSGVPLIQETDHATRLDTPLWRDRDALSTLVNNLILIRNGFLALAQTRGRAARRARRREIENDLMEFHNRIRGVVDKEEQALKSMTPADLLKRLPHLFWTAYRVFWNDFFYPFFIRIQNEHDISFISSVWQSRRLPRFVPAPFFERSVFLNYVLGILSEAVRLLNLYQFLYSSLMQYRRAVTRSIEILTRLRKRVPLFTLQTENILSELNLAEVPDQDRSKWMEKPESLVENLDGRPDPEAMLGKALEKAEPLVQPKAKEISLLTCRSWNAGADLSGGESYRFWVPAHFQWNEAWAIAEGMIQTLIEDQEFSRCLELPEGEGRYEYLDRSTDISDVSRDMEWRQWKRAALQKATRPVQKDMHDYKAVFAALRTETGWSRIQDRLLRKGLEIGFWRTKGTPDEKIGLAMDVYPWTAFEIRDIFFQHRIGLNRSEFVKRCNECEAEAMIPWLSWAQNMAGLEPIQVLGSDQDAIFDNALGLGEMDSTKLSHPLFGVPSIEDQHMLLKDCLDPVLMHLFRPERREDAEPRYFPGIYLQSLLGIQAEITEGLIPLFFHYSEFNGHDPYEILGLGRLTS